MMNTNNNDDVNYLKLLSIFHYITGGIIAFISLIFLFHIWAGISIVRSPESVTVSGDLSPKAFGYLFAAFGIFCFLLGEAIAVGVIASGLFMRKRKRYWFSFVIACVLCLFAPIGTILGIFTIIVLSRNSAKELYLQRSNKFKKL